MKTLIRQYARQFAASALQPTADWTIEQGIHIQQIAAPTFAEGERASYMAAQFAALALTDIDTDHLLNVYGRLPGKNPDAPALMVMAHTDTVFPAETDLTIQREGNRIYGPGLGDNSIGTAGLLGLVHALQQMNLQPACDLWFVATSREEGLGNLDGARLAYETLRKRIRQVINVEGLAFGYVYHAGIAVRRLHIVARAAGGHSWLHFGRPSATHAIVQLGSAITRIKPPTIPRTTFNIGMLEGGHSINSIATEAGMWLDLRSEERETLAKLETQVRAEIDRLATDTLTFEVTLVGDRPAGHIDISHPLVQGALTALEETGVRGTLQIGSTDGNIPLSDGCPTVTIGITRGGNAHRLDEFIERDPVAHGLRQLLILTLATAEHQTRTEQSYS